LDAVVTAALETPHSAGYINACGLPAAREAIAKHHSYPIAGGQVTADNVIVASGCSGTLELVLTALLDPGTAILVPQPGFPLYQVIAESHGASVVYYRLDPDRNWEIDLNHLQNVLSTTTAAPIRGLLLNNPSNPTGAVYSRQHLRDVVSFCDQHHLPIVADEVYGSLTFGLSEFHPMAKVAAECGNRVPVITTSGLAKQYLLPGWRCGWVVFHDNAFGTLQEVESGAKRLAQIVLGASHLIQRVIPELLPSAPALDEWKQDLKLTLERQAKFIYRRLSICHGLSAIAPQGAMYSMVRIDLSVLDVVDDVDFSTKLLQEENVFVLPGSAFGCPNTFRVVFCCDEPLLEAAADRIDQFCLRHAKPSDAIDRCRR
jgi:tyrosine aminotransferase